MSSRPVIGITCYVESVDRDPWVAQPSGVLPHGYIAHVEQAGALAVILPPRLDADQAMAAEVLARVDGLIIAGGADVESSRYGDPPHATAQGARRDRDTWELALAAESRAQGVPLLGICRGMQVMAVEAGARLEQHVPDRTGTTEHSIAPGTYGRHPVDVLPDTQLARILGAGTHAVPTYHHQAVDPRSLEHTAYRATAWHADGTLEAMEEPDGVFRLAVQWHPEAGEDNRLFRALVEAAREAGRPAAS